MSVYVDPLQRAHVTPERIDQGVDYSGTGPLLAIGRALITKVETSNTGWPGAWIEYRLLDGPDKGQDVYYAEGVTPAAGIHPGKIVSAGTPVANLIPGWHSGIEIGWASGVGTASYAKEYGGGYSEGDSTAAGVNFSDLIKRLGGPGGIQQGTTTGTYKGGALPSGGSAAPSSSGSGGGGGGILGSIGDFLSNPIPALLTAALVIAGAVLIYKGAGLSLGLNEPKLSDAARKAAEVAAK